MEPQSLSPEAEPTLAVLPSPQSLFRRSLEFYKAHFKLIATIVALPFVIAFLQALTAKSSGPTALLGLIFFIVNLIATISLMRMIAHNGESDGTLSQTYSKSAGLFIAFLWVSILSGITTLGGIILLIIPGIFLSIMFTASGYSFIAEDKRGMGALIQSWNYVKGYWWPVFGRVVFLMVIVLVVTIILGILLSVLGFESGANFKQVAGEKENVSAVALIVNQAISLFVLAPFSLIYSYFLYESLRTAKAGAPAVDADKVRKVIMVFMGIAFLGLIIAVSVGGIAALKYGSQLERRLQPGSPLPAAAGASSIFNFLK